MISYVEFYQLSLHEQRVLTIFEDMRKIWSMEEFVHFKGGSTL